MPATENKTLRHSNSKTSQPADSRNGTSANGVVHAKAERTPRPKWPGSHSKSRQQAVLQSAVEAGSDRLEVVYHSGKVDLSFCVAGQELLQRRWEAKVATGGKSFPVAGPWELNLWHADEDCDYLELTCLVTEGLRIDRQILLSRTDRFAMLADAVIRTAGDQLEYTARWQLSPSIDAERPGATPELRLRSRRRAVARIFPVGLSLEKLSVRESGGSLEPAKSANGDGAGIELRQSCTGSCLFAPLIIDWHPDRRNAPVDWRALTVTEEEVIVRPDRAAGHRIRIGDYQLLMYRSLQPTEDTRCLLGYHTRFETAIGQFLASGNVRQIMATVPDDE